MFSLLFYLLQEEANVRKLQTSCLLVTYIYIYKIMVRECYMQSYCTKVGDMSVKLTCRGSYRCKTCNLYLKSKSKLYLYYTNYCMLLGKKIQ